MLYEMARRYDEWPGENYEGSSARGAMKGWVRARRLLATHVAEPTQGREHLTPSRARRRRGARPAAPTTASCTAQIRDMHAALNEAGIL